MEQENVSGEIPVPEQLDTVAAETEVNETPEGVTELEDKPESKVFTQEEVDAIIGKKLAKERRKFERELATKSLERPVVEVKTDIKLADFSTPEEYAEALATVKAQQLITQTEQKKQHITTLDTYREREEAAREKYDDFDQVALNENVPITETMAEVILSSEIGPDLLYHLGSEGLKEAQRISKLPAKLQPYELGKLEVKLASSPKEVKKTTSAPPPINPVTAKSSGNATFDTTDPRAIKAMSTSEWIEAERKRQIKKMEASRTF